MHDRRRNALVLLIVAGLLAASAAAIAIKPTVLGLDLKGGVSLVYKGQATAESKVDTTSLNSAIEIMRTRVDRLGVAQPEIQRTGSDEISVALPNVTNAQQAEEQVGKTAQMHFYDWETNVIGPNGRPAPEETAVTGGENAGAASAGLTEYEAVLRAAKRKPHLRKNDTTWQQGCTPQQSEATIGPKAGCIYGQWYLLDSKTKQVVRGPENLRSQLEAKKLEAKYGASLQEVRVNPGTIVVRAHPVEGANGKVIDAEPDRFYVLNDDPVLNGSQIKNPRQSFENGTTGAPVVTFEFTKHGASIFERVTKEIAERGRERQLPGVSKAQAEQHFAIVLDEQLITVPRIDYTANPEGIDAANGSEISGGFTISSAQALANELQSGALPIKLELISNSQVSATLGKEALSQGLTAGIIGLAVVSLFLLLFYRVLGLVAIGGLAVYGVYFFALIKLIPVTLTLPGIAGLILTIGVAADANIVIFERVKEEIRGGRSVIAGIAAGYKKGFAAIVDANVVTFMTAFILFALATAEVQGFAFMLGIGTLVSLFTAVLATQAALGVMGRSRAVSHPALLGAARKRFSWKVDFMGASRWFFTLSGVILLVGAIAIGSKGIDFGFDFTGGTRIQTSFVRPVSAGEIRTVLSGAGIHGAVVQSYHLKGGGSGYDITLKKLGPTGVQHVKAELNAKLPHTGAEAVKNFNYTSIGPTFGQTIANDAVIAIIVSLIVIAAYIALRFEWKYAVPVLIALAHDLLITAGIYALTGREVTSATVAALLTILGYSMYDTIIVFDRIRENVPRMPRAAFSQIVNRSMSEVVTRSLATSFCTLLPVIALLIFGGATLQDFAFALLVGIASGAYSSIFIASPVLTHWKERESVYRNRRARLTGEIGYVPAYATGASGQPLDVEPAARRRRQRRGLLSAEEPGEQISQEEFEQLVRDLDIEAQPSLRGGGAALASRRSSRRSRAGAERQTANGLASSDRGAPPQGRGASGGPTTPKAPPRLSSRDTSSGAADADSGSATGPSARGRGPEARGGSGAEPLEAQGPARIAGSRSGAEPAGDDGGEAGRKPPPAAADATPEELVMKDQKRRERARRPRNRRHGRSR